MGSTGEPIITTRHSKDGKTFLASQTKNVKEPSEAQRNARIRFGIVASLGKGAPREEVLDLVRELHTGPVAGEHRRTVKVPIWAKELAEWESMREHPEKTDKERKKIVEEIIKVIA